MPRSRGDARGGARVVAGDHQHPDPGRGRLGDRRPRLGARRVDDPDEAEVDELLLERLVARPAARRPGSGRYATASVRSARSASRSTVARTRCAASSASGAHLAGGALARCSARAARRAPPSSRRRSPSSRRGRPRRVLISLRSEVNGTSPSRSKRASRASVQARDLRLGDEERRLGRDRPGSSTRRPAPAGRRRWRGCRPRARPRTSSSSDRVVERPPVDAQLALGPVAGAGDLDLARRRDDLLDRHLVLRQRAGLVGADDRRRSERLHRRRASSRSRAGAPCAARRARARPTGSRAGPPGTAATASETPTSSTSTTSEACSISAVSEDRRDDHGRDRDHGDAERAADPVDLALERRRSLLRAAEQAGDVAHLGRHPGRRHDRAPAPARDGRAVEHHVRRGRRAPPARRAAPTSFEHRLALAGERGLGDRQRGSLRRAGRRR